MQFHIDLWHKETAPLRVALFMPFNNAALRMESSEDGVLTHYGLPMEKAWAMFDLFATPATAVSRAGERFLMSDADAPARLAKLRAETMGQPVPESEAA